MLNILPKFSHPRKKPPPPHKGFIGTVGESAQKVDSGRIFPCHTGELNLPQWHAGLTLYQLSHIPTPKLHPCPITCVMQYDMLPLFVATVPFVCVQITVLHVVPPVVLFLAKHPLVSKFNLSSIKYMISGAAPLGVGLTFECQDRLGFPIYQGTVSPCIICNYCYHSRQNTVEFLIYQNMVSSSSPCLYS